jgi:hypothetical protein
MNRFDLAARARCLLVCAAAAVGSLAHAEPAEPATWVGSVTIKDRPVAVTLTLVRPGAGTGAAETQWHYGVPRNCGLVAEYSGDREDGIPVYSFKGSNGGYCDQLLDGYFSLRTEAGMQATATVAGPSGKAVESVRLKRQPAAAGRP